MIHRLLVCCAALTLALPGRASAQAYIWARVDRAALIPRVDEKDGLSQSIKAVNETKEGIWMLLVHSNTAGYGAVVAVSDENGRNPDYFISTGQATPAQAIAKARTEAILEGRERKRTPVVLTSFRIENKYSFEDPAYTTLRIKP